MVEGSMLWQPSGEPTYSMNYYYKHRDKYKKVFEITS